MNPERGSVTFIAELALVVFVLDSLEADPLLTKVLFYVLFHDLLAVEILGGLYFIYPGFISEPIIEFPPVP